MKPNYFKKRLSVDSKLTEERAKYRIYCKCGHSIVFFPFEKSNKKICSYCGYYIYKNKNIEFKEKVRSSINKEEKKVNEKK